MSTVTPLMRAGDDRIVDATKEDHADCAKVLAVALVLYQRRYGDLEFADAQEAAARAELRSDLEDEFSAAMETFVPVLSEVVEDNKGRTLH